MIRNGSFSACPARTGAVPQEERGHVQAGGVLRARVERDIQSRLRTGDRHSLWCGIRGAWLLFVLLVTSSGLSQAFEEEYTVGEVTFVGNEAVGREVLLDTMSLRPPRLFRKTEYSFVALADDIDALEALYRNRGFLNASVDIAGIDRDTAEERVAITIEIEEGARTFVDSVVFAGNRIVDDSELRPLVKLEPGEPVRFDVFTGARTRIRAELASRGHLFAEVSADLRDTADQRAVLVYTIFEGPAVLAGEAEIEGLEGVKPVVVERELRFDPGDTLTPRLLGRSITRLYSTGLFTFVRVEPLDTFGVLTGRTGETVTAPVLIEIREGRMLDLQLGGGYGSFEGLYVSGKVGYKNLFGLGHSVDGSGRLAFNLRELRVTYSYPWIFGIPLNADFASFITYYDREAFEGLVGGGTAALSWRWGRHTTYRAWTRFDRLGGLDQPPPTDDFPDVPEANSVVFGLSVNRDTRNNLFFPGTATYAYLEGEIAGPGIPWSNQFYKVGGDIRGYIALWGGRVTLASAAFAGYVNGYGQDDDAVPASELYEPGIDGLRPIRGYDSETLLPRDENGNIRGARVAFVFTLLEVGFPIYWWFRGAVFVDGGSVWLKADDIDGIGDFEWSIGPGIRLVLPIGLARLDYGIRLDGDLDLEGRVHFGVGLPF